MTRFTKVAILCFGLCPLLAAQPAEDTAKPAIPQPTEASQPADAPLSGTASERNRIIKEARTIHINSETVFLTIGTLERALMKQKDWDRLGLNIVNNQSGADLELQINRVVFTHIHTYILTNRCTSIVLAAGRVRALDGVVASGPMAEQIVKLLSAARLQAQPAVSNGGL